MINQLKPKYYLIIGVILVALAHMTVSIGYMAWVAYTPFLIYLKLTVGLRSRILLLVGLIAGWSLVVAKIISPPMSYALVFLYSVPISLIHLPAFLVWDRYKLKPWGFFLFPAVLTVLEWIQYTLTPLASWGVAAYTQSEYLSIVQMVSIAGMPGLSFLIYWVNVGFAETITEPAKASKRIVVPTFVLLIAVVYGEIRLDLAKATGRETVKVAAVGTTSEASGLPLPSEEETGLTNEQLFQRTQLAALAGARIIVWNEAATFIMPDDEEQWIRSIEELAKENGIYLFASYVMPTSIAPLHYDNKYVIAEPSGSILYEYHKHQPVPGEPATQGVEPLETFAMFGSNVGGLICYDYDFPYLAAELGKHKADIVAVPSSDWRGIDPIHTEMAALRSIEQGLSTLRSTRFGLSAAIDPYGEMVARMSSFDDNDKVMTAALPARRITTVYSIIGDLFIYLMLGSVIALIGLDLINGIQR